MNCSPKPGDKANTSTALGCRRCWLTTAPPVPARMDCLPVGMLLPFTPPKIAMTFTLPPIVPLVHTLALGWFFLRWIAYAYCADKRRSGKLNLAGVLNEYRLRWMTRVLERENRIVDTVALQTVMRSDSRSETLATPASPVAGR